MSGYDRVVALQAHRSMALHHAARVYEAMAAISEVMRDLMDDDYEPAHRATATEIRAGLSLTRRAADLELGLALDSVQRLPHVWEALDRGVQDVRKARVIVSGTRHLSVAAAQDATAQLLEDAGRLTTGQLRARIRDCA